MTDFSKILQKAKEIEKKMKESQENLKKIQVNGVSGGDVVKITRVSKTNLKSISYRLVVENEQNIDKDDIKYDDMIDHSYNSVTNDEETYMKKVTITLTAGDVAENHVGMQQIGKKVPKGKGFTVKDFKNIIKKCKQKDIKTELINLNKLKH